MRIASFILLFLFNLSIMLEASPTFQTLSISYESAAKLIQEVLDEAKKRKLTLAVAVNDPAGHLIAFGRTDGTKPVVIEVAMRKAYSAAVARNKTSVLQEKAQPGGPGYGGITSLKNIMTIRGGVPIQLDGQYLGGIGVSGTSAEEDEEIAELVLKKFKFE